MKLLKPNWVSHDGNPIFSIAIHPDESRFATGGQSDGGCSGRIIIWNTSPVVNADEERNKKVPKMLCVMDNHLACVNCVRWSGNGRFLASGGDDRLIMIWQFSGYGSAAAFGSSMKTSGLTGERWRCVHTLKGHDGDILDLAWSPGDQWLASCSIDNTVVIWNADNFPEVVSVLKGHTSLVKGVTWDPVGTYLASQSDDRTVRIWRTLDWKEETIISEPFEECGATTHVLRLSWSPDGGYLVSAHAMNNCGPTAQIIERNGWLTNMDFVGHRKAITSTCFSGRMFRYHPSKNKDKDKQYTVCAVGSRDRSVSIWLTSLRRPLVVIHDLFEDSVMDFSWSISGLRMLCCSWDGSVAYMEFKPEEVGVPLNNDEMSEFFKSTYGKATSIMSRPLIIENPAMLEIQKRKSDGNAAQPVTPTKPQTPTKYPTKQIEVRTPTGRRRITPVFVASQEVIGGVPCPFGSASAFGSSNLSHSSSSPSKAARKISFENKKNQDPTASSSQLKPPAPQKSKDVPSLTPAEDFKQKKVEIAQEKLKKALDNRLSEKTKPGSTPESNGIQPNKTPEEKLDKVTKNKGAVIEANTIAVRKVDKTLPNTTPKKVGRPSTTGLNVKRKADSDDHEKSKQKRIRKEQKSAQQNVSSVPKTTSASKGSHPACTTIPAVIRDPLPPKKLKKSFTVEVMGQKKSTTTLKIQNELQTTGNTGVMSHSSSLHKLTCLVNSEVTWDIVLPSPIVAAHVSSFVTCIACHDKSVRFLSAKSGRQILPNCCMESPIYEVYCLGYKASVILACGKLYSWDIKRRKVLLSAISFSHLLPTNKKRSAPAQGAVASDDSDTEHKDGLLKNCKLLQSGIPLLTFSNDVSYTYNVDLAAWTMVHSSFSPIEVCANYKPTHEDGIKTNGILSSLHKSNSGSGARALHMFSSTANNQKNATMSLLEEKVQSSSTLASVSEYKFWMLSYIRYLVEERMELKLREVCDEFLGPNHISETVRTDNSVWQPYIMNISKRTFLCDEILPIIGSNLSFQRLYTEYQDQLDLPFA